MSGHLQYKCNRCLQTSTVSNNDIVSSMYDGMGNIQMSAGLCGKRLDERGNLCTGVKILEEDSANESR